MERLAAQQAEILNSHRSWEYLLSVDKSRVSYLSCRTIPGLAAQEDASEVLVIDDCLGKDLNREGVLSGIRKVLAGKKQLYISYQGDSRKLFGILKKEGFKIEEDYWEYSKKDSRSFWLIPLNKPEVFFFSLNAILDVVADKPMILKKTFIYAFYRLGILKYFISHCLIAKKAGCND